VLPAFESAGALERELSASPAPARLAASGQRPSGAIVFDDVSFLHEPDAETAEARGVGNLCLRIEPAEFIGITGPSGSGKTTFADLLVGLLEPQSGRITVGGRSLAGAGLEAWRDGVSYVAQDPFLSHDTIRRNLSWARPEADETQMWDALRAAGADGLVRGMPKGLDAVVGERGALVSGGERQRIAIARALLRRPQLLVLDEATGAIDLDGERTILERLSALRPRPTIVLIAHRNESLALCDRVIRIEDGRVLGGGVELPRRAPWAAAAPDFDWSRQPSPQS
jgi:ATP-binding cassette subfamily C protein